TPLLHAEFAEDATERPEPERATSFIEQVDDLLLFDFSIWENFKCEGEAPWKRQHRPNFRVWYAFVEPRDAAVNVASALSVLVVVELTEGDRLALTQERYELLLDRHERQHRVGDVLEPALVAQPLRCGICVVGRKKRHDVQARQANNS